MWKRVRVMKAVQKVTDSIPKSIATEIYGRSGYGALFPYGRGFDSGSCGRLRWGRNLKATVVSCQVFMQIVTYYSTAI